MNERKSSRDTDPVPGPIRRDVYRKEELSSWPWLSLSVFLS